MKNNIFIILIVTISFISCKKENCFDCVKTTGKIITQERYVSNFNSIYMEDKIQLFLTQDSVFKIEVEAGENLQSLIKVELDGETLRVHNANRCNWVRGYKHDIKVYVSAPYFKYIENNGTGTIQSLNTIAQNSLTIRTSNSGDMKLDINTNQIYASSHGNGDIYFTGVTNNLQGDFTGTNFLYAKKLSILNYVYMHQVSIGNAYINAPDNGRLDVKIERDGNIYYSGNPNQIELERIGKGNLIKE